MSVILSILVLNVHHRDPKVELSWFWRKFVLNGLGRIVCKRAKPKKSQVGGLTPDKQEKSDAVKTFKPKNTGTPDVDMRRELIVADDGNEWRLAAEVLDRSFLLSYVIVTVLVNLVVLFILPVWARAKVEAEVGSETMGNH